ncbi:MAG: hypothetical protein V1906_03410, partial [Candidatus Woesearchaeota archaeon]
MKRGMIILFLAMILLSFVAYAEDMVFEAVEVGQVEKTVLSNGYVVLKQKGQPVTQYNPQDLSKIFNKVDINNEELEVFLDANGKPQSAGIISGNIVADVANKRLTINSLAKNSSAKYSSGEFQLLSRKILLSVTRGNDVLVSAKGSPDKTTFFNITVSK